MKRPFGRGTTLLSGLGCASKKQLFFTLSSHNHGSVGKWDVSDSYLFEYSHFPLNNDYGRKGTVVLLTLLDPHFLWGRLAIWIPTIAALLERILHNLWHTWSSRLSPKGRWCQFFLFRGLHLFFIPFLRWLIFCPFWTYRNWDWFFCVAIFWCEIRIYIHLSELLPVSSVTS